MRSWLEGAARRRSRRHRAFPAGVEAIAIAALGTPVFSPLLLGPPRSRSIRIELADPVAGLNFHEAWHVRSVVRAATALRWEEAERRLRIQRAGRFADRTDVDARAFEGGVGG
jgi:hypothetical protein